MRRREVRRQRRSRFTVRPERLSVLEFRQFFLESYLPHCGRWSITRHAFELFTDGRDNDESGDRVWQWVRFAKNEESLKAHLCMGDIIRLKLCVITSHSVCSMTFRRFWAA